MSVSHLPIGAQKTIISESDDVLKERRKVKIISHPGTGKTTILDMLAKKHFSKRFLYLTFSAEMAKEVSARMGPNVYVSTFHAFTLSYASKNTKIVQKASAIFIQEALSISYGRAQQVKRLFDKFIDTNHIRISEVSNGFNEKTIYYCGVLLEKMWKKEISVTQSYQVKEFFIRYQGKKFPGGYDCILLDEFQDFNDCAVGIVNNIKGMALYAVGDPDQAILGFTGSIDALDKVESEKIYFLKTNFRSSKNVIDLSNGILKEIMGQENMMELFPSGGKNLDTVGVITRTNEKIISFIDLFDSYALSKKNKNIFDLPIILSRWIEFNEIPKGYLYLRFIKDEDAFYEYVDSNGDNRLSTAYGIAKRKGYNELVRLKKLSESRHHVNAKVTILTGHAAKGLEFGSVRIASDFPCLYKLAKKVNEGEYTVQELKEECRLYFVAVTRASSKIIDKSPNAILSQSEKEFIKNTIIGKVIC